MIDNFYEQVMESADYIRSHISKHPTIAVVLGSGLGNLTADFAETAELRIVKSQISQYLRLRDIKVHCLPVNLEKKMFLQWKEDFISTKDIL